MTSLADRSTLPYRNNDASLSGAFENKDEIQAIHLFSTIYGNRQNVPTVTAGAALTP